jgi:acyl-CoA synthetase (AMP-forming)/AMP-acid ligase II
MIFDIDEPQRRNDIALIDAGSRVSWTYGQLSDAVRTRQDCLAQPGLVFLFCGNDLPSVAWYLACMESGVPVALASGQLETSLRADLISQYSPEWIIADAKPDSGDYRATSHDRLWQGPPRSETPLHPDLAVLLSTSGSTGSPKLVRLTRANVTANADSIREALAIAADHLPVAHLPLYYSYGLSVLNSHLLAGARILLTNCGLMSADFWDAIRQYKANSFSGVPYTYQMLRRLDIDKVDAPSLLTFTQAGGKLDTDNISHFHERVARRGGSFWVMYGQTEATARMTILPANELDRKLGSAGKAIPGGRLSIKTESGEITSDAGVAGELVYDGPNVMMGYAESRQDLNRGDELHGRLRTGDRASLDAEGFVYIMGRSKRDAKLFGLRVNLDELEALVKKHGPAAAVAGEDRVFIFCEFGSEQDLQNIRAELATKLRVNHSAFQFRRIDQLPTNSSGKIDYARLQSRI